MTFVIKVMYFLINFFNALSRFVIFFLLINNQLLIVINHSGEVWYFVFAEDDINTEYIYKYFGNSAVQFSSVQYYTNSSSFNYCYSVAIYIFI